MSNATYALVYNNRNRPSALKMNGSIVANYLYNGLEQMARRQTLSPLTPVGYTEYIYDREGRLTL